MAPGPMPISKISRVSLSVDLGLGLDLDFDCDFDSDLDFLDFDLESWFGVEMSVLGPQRG